jgi:N-terminal domain of reverse transcriptase
MDRQTHPRLHRRDVGQPTRVMGVGQQGKAEGRAARPSPRIHPRACRRRVASSCQRHTAIRHGGRRCRAHDGAVGVGAQGSPGDGTGQEGSSSAGLWASHRRGRRAPERLEGQGTRRSPHARPTVDSPPREGWPTRCWQKIERVVVTRHKRLDRAPRRGHGTSVRTLPRRVLKARSATRLAGRRVRQEHRGKNPAGGEGVQACPPAERRDLADPLRRHARAQPGRRVRRPTPGPAERRPWGRPTLHDRALHAVVKRA